MRVLALDTATEACSVALLSEEGLFGSFKEIGRGHAEEVLAMVDAILTEAGVVLGALDGIAASVGPGAFTGVRISVSVAQGLAFGAELPVVAVSTLEALALQALDTHRADNVIACLDARMGEVYWGCFSRHPTQLLNAQGESALSAAAAVRLAVTGCYQGIGRGFRAYADLRSLPGLVLPGGACDALPDAKDMVRLGAARLAAGEGRDPADLTPLYLRDKVALTESERNAIKRALD